MPRPPLRQLPQPGSTDWAAQQFYRVLTEEERIAAERERLRALGWRPQQRGTASSTKSEFLTAGGSATRPGSEPHTPDDAHDAYTDLIDLERAYRNDLEAEARRRLAAANLISGFAPEVPQTTPKWIGGGRFAQPVPQNEMPSGSRIRPISLTDRSDTNPVPAVDEPQHPQVAAVPLIVLGLGGLATLGAYGAYEAARPRVRSNHPLEFDFDFSPRDAPPPEPLVLPHDLDPEEARLLQQQFGGPLVNIPGVVEISPESLPIQEENFPNFVFGPDISNPPQFPIWMEARRGTEPTRSLNNEIKQDVQADSRSEDLPISHIGGARDEDGNDIAETYLRGPSAGSTAGGSYIDISFLHDETLRRLFIQTIDTYADGRTPDKRERLANIRVIRNMKNGDIVVLVPKPRGGAVLDREALSNFLRPLLRELGTPVPPVDPRGTQPEESLWHLF